MLLCYVWACLTFIILYIVALRETLNSNPKQMRDHIMSQSVNILACYRKNCSNQSAEGQLILPEAMKLLPVYSNCIIKSTALQGIVVDSLGL